jgi:hypothetical protein
LTRITTNKDWGVLRSYVTLSCVGQQPIIDVSGQPIPPIFKDQVSKKTNYFLEFLIHAIPIPAFPKVFGSVK